MKIIISDGLLWHNEVGPHENIIRKYQDPPKIAYGLRARTGARRAQRNGKPWERR